MQKGFLIAAIASFSILCLQNVVVCAAVKNKGCTIESTSNMAGTIVCKFTDNAALMHIDKMGLTIITRAPKWDMSVFNEMNRKYMTMNQENWRKRFAKNLGRHGRHGASVAEEFPPAPTGKKEKIQGYNSSEFVIKRLDKSGKTYTSTEMWVAEELNGPKQLQEIYHVVLSMPENFHGTPLRVKQNQNGRFVPILEAHKVSREELGAEVFKPLSGYKKVNDEIALMMDDSEGGDLLGPAPGDTKAGAASKVP